MTERPSQNKQILSKLDDLTESISGIKQDLSGIKQQIKMQPQIDAEQHKTIEKQILQHSEDIKLFRENQTWIVRTLILELISIVSFVIYSYIK